MTRLEEIRKRSNMPRPTVTSYYKEDVKYLLAQLAQARSENARLRNAVRILIQAIKTCGGCDECILEADAALAQPEGEHG